MKWKANSVLRVKLNVKAAKEQAIEKKNVMGKGKRERERERERKRDDRKTFQEYKNILRAIHWDAKRFAPTT